MKVTLLLTTLAAAGQLSDHAFVVHVAAKPSGGSRPSGSRPSGSRPSGSSFSPPSASPPSFNRPSSPTSPSASRPPAPTFNSRPAVKTPSGPISATTRSPYNPSPAYKPLSKSGAPTVRSGGGGYGSTLKKVAAAAAVGALAYTAVTVAAGYFLYGGRHSSPYCRGSDQDRFLTGRCPRGTSSQAHGCKTSIPLCPIPAAVKSRWALGSDAPPKVDVLFDKSVCSLIELPAEDDGGAAADAAPAAAADAGANADEAGSEEEPSDPVAATGADAGGEAATLDATTDTNATDAGDGRRLGEVEGESGLDACFRRILAAGGCAPHNAANMFQYDDASGTCGCCSSVQVTTLAADDFASAVYGYREEETTAPPDHCVSGSTMYYPGAAGGPDAVHNCECGTCASCGGGKARYMDWSGPFVVPDAVGDVSFADAAKTVPQYDPVDTCLCDDFTEFQCGSEVSSYQSSAFQAFGGGVRTPNLAVAFSTIFLLVGFVRRG